MTVSPLLPTASALERAFICPASTVLPQAKETTKWSKHGTGVHKFLFEARTNREAALAQIDDPNIRAACEALDLDELPVDPSKFAAEVTFTWDWKTGFAAELGRNLERDYSAAKTTDFVGTADIVGVSGDSVVVLDWKSGYGHVEPPATNRQLRFLLLAAARTYGATKGVVGLIFPRPDGPRWLIAEIDEFELLVIADEMRRLAQSQEYLAMQRSPDPNGFTVAGDHCKHCASFTHCPFQVTLAVSLGMEPVTTLEHAPVLTPEIATRAWENLKLADTVLERVRRSLYAYAEANTIHLPNGMVVGPVETKRESLDAAITRDVCAELFNYETAMAALELSTSKAALDRAVKEYAKASGKKVAPLVREALKRIGEANGIATKVSTTIKEHKQGE